MTRARLVERCLGRRGPARRRQRFARRRSTAVLPALPLGLQLALGLALALSPACTAERACARGASDAEEHAAELLARVLAPRGVSGREGPVREAMERELRRIDPDWRPRTDEAGNLHLQLGSGGRSVLFIAHMDEIGLEVTAVRDDGLLETVGRGGFHDHTYRATAVELVTKQGTVLPGITLPAAAGGGAGTGGAAAGTGAGGSSASAATAPILVDVGARSAAEVAGLGIAAGDTATVPKELLRLGAHRVAGRGNDDRVGCTALLLVLEALARAGDGDGLKDRSLTFVWSTREEVGLEGADHAARTVRPAPDLVVAVDTFVTSDSPREDPRYALARLGDGPVLRALDNTSVTPPAMLARVRAIAAREGIALQTGTMGGGNDGSRFVPEGAINCPLAWPQRNSHSRVETADLRDVVRLAELIEAVARDG